MVPQSSLLMADDGCGIPKTFILFQYPLFTKCLDTSCLSPAILLG